jgi:bacteriorhodopsin
MDKMNAATLYRRGGYGNPPQQTEDKGGFRLFSRAHEVTFLLSMLGQVTTLVVSAIALGGTNPPVLQTIILLELVVQIVEFAWYFIIGIRYAFFNKEFEIWYRYLDWAVTTPIMMTSILLFVLWDTDRECDNVLGHWSRVLALVIIVLMDLLMLFVGAAYEVPNSTEEKNGIINFFVSVRGGLDRLACGMKGGGLILGFIPFIGVFTPVLVVVAQNFTVNGFISWLITFLTWLLYGVVALLGADFTGDGQPWMWSEEARNTAYNLLDIFSKNAVGLIVSTVALNGNFTIPDTANCTTI